MAQSNIDKFDEIAGRIFADLYSSFPLRHPLGLHAYLDTPNVFDPDGFTGAELTKDAEFVKSTIEWLIHADFISAGYFHGEYFTEVILTPKGLESLKLMPESLTSPAGNQLTDAVKNGSKETIKMLTNQILAVGVKIAAQKYGLSS